MELDWHENKRISNLEKHGIDFAELGPSLLNPLRLERVDNRRDYGETRVNTLTVLNGRTVVITYTMRGRCYWIISARFAHEKERAIYER